MKNSITSSQLCTLIHLVKNQLEIKRSEIANLSQYTTKVIRETYTDEVEELVSIKYLLEADLKGEKLEQQLPLKTK
ncbi:hypothetical protein EOPP23_06825 [Endozoicomonas sp. OPT23]|uniref:hypothetical protein n=1 Tax=Endozoicomonas sp. OPT23 TaxID=2072845 RepID=UPI00129A7375|nr:hypothetical protein [Endozoicomonas sp. OPT23]MRI32699.1 hypothetical protein [Endozoicomonas sp. OPT23]